MTISCARKLITCHRKKISPLVTHTGGTWEPVQNKQILIGKIELSKIKEFRKETVDCIMLPQIVWKMNKIFY